MPSLWRTVNSALLFCFFSVVCASAVRTLNRGKGGEERVEGERKKPGWRENLNCLSLKKKNQNQNNDQSHRVMANCPESLSRAFSNCPFYQLWVNPGHCDVLGRSEALPNRPRQSRGKLRCHFLTWNRISPPWCVLRPLPPSPSCLLLPNELTCMMNISAHGLSNRQHY